MVANCISRYGKLARFSKLIVTTMLIAPAWNGSNKFFFYLKYFHAVLKQKDVNQIIKMVSFNVLHICIIALKFRFSKSN